MDNTSLQGRVLFLSERLFMEIHVTLCVCPWCPSECAAVYLQGKSASEPVAVSDCGQVSLCPLTSSSTYTPQPPAIRLSTQSSKPLACALELKPGNRIL